MKNNRIKRATAILMMLCMVVGLALGAFASYPAADDYVYDGAGILSSSLIQTIQSTNETLYDKVKARISVCVVESLGGEAIDDYAAGIFDAWKPGEGVILIVTTGEKTYYAVQSVRVASVLDNEKLDSILKEFLEPDFAAGDTARGIQKTVNKLSGYLKTELAAADAAASDTQASEGSAEEKGVTFGSVILSILKIIGWTVLVLVVGFIAFFVAALFNDTAADLMNRYVFSHFNGSRNQTRRQDYYDERLYGTPRDRRPQGQQSQQGQRRPSSPQNGAYGTYSRDPRMQNGGQRQVYDRYRQGGVRYDDEYYGRTQQSGNVGQRQPQHQQMRNGQQRVNRPVQSTYDEDGFTRKFDISEINQRR